MPDFDAEYRRLRQDGGAGWGGAAFARRMEGWAHDVAALRHAGAVPEPPARLLELGSGNGALSALLARAGYAVEGIEISPEAVAWARELFAAEGLTGRFRAGDAAALPFDDGSFDLVMDAACLHCLLGEARARCLGEARRVLRAGGTFVVSTMCGPPRSEDARARFDAGTGILCEGGVPARTLKPEAAIVAEVEGGGLPRPVAAAAREPLVGPPRPGVRNGVIPRLKLDLRPSTWKAASWPAPTPSSVAPTAPRCRPKPALSRRAARSTRSAAPSGRAGPRDGCLVPCLVPGLDVMDDTALLAR